MNLPTIDVTADQHTMILDAFGSEDAYIAWLTSNVNSYVLAVENNNLSNTKQVEIQEALELIRAELPEVPVVE